MSIFAMSQGGQPRWIQLYVLLLSAIFFLEECGGNYKDNHGIKDCSDCLIPPHRPNGYDHINKIIMEINEKKSDGEVSSWKKTRNNI